MIGSALTRSEGRWQGHDTHGTGVPSSLHGRGDETGPEMSSAQSAGLSATDDHPSANATTMLARPRTDALISAPERRVNSLTTVSSLVSAAEAPSRDSRVSLCCGGQLAARSLRYPVGDGPICLTSAERSSRAGDRPAECRAAFVGRNRRCTCGLRGRTVREFGALRPVIARRAAYVHYLPVSATHPRSVGKRASSS
jgi:hypothetical protein